MRTTIELPPELMRAAKSRSAARGETLKRLITRAVEAELGLLSGSGTGGKRVQLPLFGDPRRHPVKVTNEDIAGALSDADLKGLAMKPVRR